MIENACELSKKEKIVKKGDYVVITAGAPIGITGSTEQFENCTNKLALTSFKPRVCFIYDINSTFSFYNSTISVSLFCRFYGS